MTINLKDIKSKLKNEPLTEGELSLVRATEEYVDSEILSQYGNSTLSDVSIDLRITSFKYTPNFTKFIYTKEPRKLLMQKELERRYKNAGWKIDIKYDDGLDEPNMSGPDLWILSEK